MAFLIGQGIDIGQGIIITYEYPVAPSIITNPFLTGNPRVRSTLVSSTGIWNSGIPSPIIGYLYQWQSNNANISNANSNTYTIPYTLVNSQIRCQVTAFNNALSNSVFTLNTTNVLPNVPLPPTSATATLGTLGNVNINFVPNIDDGGAAVDIFYIDSNTGNYSSSTISSPGVIKPSNLGTYTFDVRAHNIVGNSGPTTTNAITVTLSPNYIGNITTVNDPIDIVTSPDNKHTYVLNNNSIRCYSINANTGLLTFSSVNNISPVGIPAKLAIRPNGNTVYALFPTSGSGTTSIFQYDRNSNTGALTLLGTDNPGVGYDTMTIHPNGNYLYTVGFDNTSNRVIRSYSIGNTGQLTGLSGINPISGIASSSSRGLEVTEDGTSLYYQTNTPGLTIQRIYKWDVNSSNGAFSNISFTNVSNAFIALNFTVSDDSKSLYVTGGSPNIIHYDRNTSTGNLTLVGTVAGNISFHAVQALIPNSNNILYTGTGSFFRNTTTGNLTYTNSTNRLNYIDPASKGAVLNNDQYIYVTDKLNDIINEYQVI